tara:strand:+ start:122 stop:1117 length:996 start_codon:yes stop_codon:yes gene_type:complete
MSEDLASLFHLVSEEKKQKKLKEEQKRKEMKNLVGEIDIGSIFSQVKQSITEDKENAEKIAKQAVAFESWLFSETKEEKEEIVAEVAGEFREELQEDVALTREEIIAEEVEDEDLIEQSLGLLSEPSNVKQGKDPLTPTDQKFATLDDLQKHYSVFLNRIQQQLSTVGGGGENNNDGYEYVSDKNLESNPIALSADTWTKVTNDGTSGSTSREHLPEGVTRIYDTTTQRIKLDQLPTNGWLIFRFGIKVNPNVDNLTLKARIKYTLPDGYNFYLVAPGALLNDGAGIEYEEQYTLTFYVGDQDSKDGYGELEVRADGTCSITDSAFMTIVG